MKMIFIITLTACLFYISQAKAHDTKQVLDDETARLIHQMTINITNEVFRNLPNILDSISAKLREEADLRYKCSLQGNWITYANKECDKFK
tara:strand:- start:56 stop:328 length:273 start_codon:yes stop_codon:yes gene_type:complete